MSLQRCVSLSFLEVISTSCHARCWPSQYSLCPHNACPAQACKTAKISAAFQPCYSNYFEVNKLLCAQLSAKVVAAKCIREQQAHLRAFSIVFSDAVNGNFAQAHPELLQSFTTLVSSMQVEARLTASSYSDSTLGFISRSCVTQPCV